jgi:hypothetical protein
LIDAFCASSLLPVLPAATGTKTQRKRVTLTKTNRYRSRLRSEHGFLVAEEANFGEFPNIKRVVTILCLRLSPKGSGPSTGMAHAGHATADPFAPDRQRHAMLWPRPALQASCSGPRGITPPDPAQAVPRVRWSFRK